MTLLNAPGSYPVPASRGPWRISLHHRSWDNSSGQSLALTQMVELDHARSRQLQRAWCQPATFTFTLDGHSPAAALISELQTDVVAWRWDDQTGTEIAAFRGPVCQTEDQLTEQSHTINITCHDYLAMLSRRYLTTTYSVTQRDQDSIVRDLLALSTAPTASNGTSFTPGGFLPITYLALNPDGSTRSSSSGQLRDRTYLPSTEVGATIDDLAKVINGFDYDLVPNTFARALGYGYYTDILRGYYPYQGVNRTTPSLVYGSTVSALTRTINSGDYANYWRVLGNSGSSDPAAPQLFSEAWNADSNDITRIPIGLWMSTDNAADVTIQSTLDQKAQGNLALSGLVQPTYAVTLRPGTYSWGNPNMGDVVPLVVQSGRLNVNTTVRVLGITFDIGDDGNEDVELTVGRPAATLAQLLTKSDRDVDALTRR